MGLENSHLEKIFENKFQLSKSKENVTWVEIYKFVFSKNHVL